jgi:hypothetical protein
VQPSRLAISTSHRSETRACTSLVAHARKISSFRKDPALFSFRVPRGAMQFKGHSDAILTHPGSTKPISLARRCRIRRSIPPGLAVYQRCQDTISLYIQGISTRRCLLMYTLLLNRDQQQEHIIQSHQTPSIHPSSVGSANRLGPPVSPKTRNRQLLTELEFYHVAAECLVHARIICPQQLPRYCSHATARFTTLDREPTNLESCLPTSRLSITSRLPACNPVEPSATQFAQGSSRNRP